MRNLMTEESVANPTNGNSFFGDMASNNDSVMNGSSAAAAAGSSFSAMPTTTPLQRGSKRSHSQVENCDCDIEVPLAKRINGLNIEQQFGSSSVPPGLQQHQQQQQQHQQQQQQQPAVHGHHHAHLRHQPDAVSFQESYPFSARSDYYESNHLLYHLHMERAQRMQQQQHQSSGNPSPALPAPNG